MRKIVSFFFNVCCKCTLFFFNLQLLGRFFKKLFDFEGENSGIRVFLSG